MKKTYLIGFVCLALVGCSPESNSKTATDDQPDVSSESRKIHLEPEGKEEIAIFEKAVNDSVKVQGIVNVTNPMYTFNIGDNVYFLWITEESGSIMNRKDDHTLYTLSRSSVEEVYRYVNKE